MKDQPVREHNPILLRNQLLKITLDFFGRFFFCKPKPLRKARHVSIDDHSGCDAECIPKHDIRSLSSYSRERKNIGHCIGNLATELIDYPLRCGTNVLRARAPIDSRQRNPAARDTFETSLP